MTPPGTPPFFNAKIAKKGCQAWGFDHFGRFFDIPPLFMPFYAFFDKFITENLIFSTHFRIYWCSVEERSSIEENDLSSDALS